MYNNGANVIRVSFELSDLFGCVVVVDSDLEIIGPTDDPILASDEATSSYRDVGELEGFDDCLQRVNDLSPLGALSKVYLSFV